MLLSVQLMGQKHIGYDHYTTEDGLPSSLLYRVVQDCDGYIWVATDAGPARFDGEEFYPLSLADGLPDNEVLKITIDDDCRIWFIHFNGRLSYLENDSVHLLGSTGVLADATIREVVQDDNIYWLVTSNRGLFKLLGDTIINYGLKEGLVNQFTTIFPMDNGDYLLGTIGSYGHYDGEQFTYYPVDSSLFAGHKKVGVTQLDNGMRIAYSPSFVLMLDDTFGYTELYATNKLAERRVILSLEVGHDGDLLIGTNMGLVVLADRGRGYQVEQELLPDQMVNNGYHDNEGNLWLATVGYGLFMFSNNGRSVISYTDDVLIDKHIVSIYPLDANTLIIGSPHGVVQRLHLNSAQVDTLLLHEGANYITSSVQINGSLLALGSSLGMSIVGVDAFEYDPDNSWTFERTNKEGEVGFPLTFELDKQYDQLRMSTIKDLLHTKQGYTYMASSSCLFVLEDIGEQYAVTSINNERTTCLALKGDSILYVGTLNGVLTVDILEASHSIQSRQLAGTLVSCLEVDDAGNVWVGTAGMGLWKLSEHGQQQFTAAVGLSSDNITALYAQGSSLWVGTNHGLDKVTPVKRDSLTVFPVTKHDGLLSNEVNCIAGYGNSIFVGTPRGLSVFNANDMVPVAIPPKPLITRLRINDSDTSIYVHYTLPYDKNDIEIDFVGLTYKSRGDGGYGYLLEGIDTTWQYTSHTSVRYPKLPPGRYTFLLKARSVDDIWSVEPVTMELNIRPPFWQTTWFRVSLSLLVVCLIITFFIVRESQIRRKEREKTAMNKRIAESRLKTLQAQMNPHFMSNALNSIQHFVLKNEGKTAGLYLMKFSRLMRSVLEASSRDEVSLAEELEALQLYLELEALRFEGRISYNIKVDERIDTQEVMVPSMLVQPFVENAIVHGLSRKLAGGELLVEFNSLPGHILCKVTDNGIGVNHHTDHVNGKEHISRSMGIIDERLELIKRDGGSRIEVEISDRGNDLNEISGTEVSIKIHLN